MVRYVAIALVTLLLGCSTPDPQVVRVPTPVIATPPSALWEPVAPADVAPFVSPSDPSAVLGMSEKGRQALVGHVNDLARRLDAWREWAGVKPLRATE